MFCFTSPEILRKINNIIPRILPVPIMCENLKLFYALLLDFSFLDQNSYLKKLTKF